MGIEYVLGYAPEYAPTMPAKINRKLSCEDLKLVSILYDIIANEVDMLESTDVSMCCITILNLFSLSRSIIKKVTSDIRRDYNMKIWWQLSKDSSRYELCIYKIISE